MTDVWRCAVCEGVNQGGRSCAACGAPLTRRSSLATAARSGAARRAHRGGPAPLERARPLPEPVRRAINRTPVEEEEWVELDLTPRFDVLPLPGGCLFSLGPRRRRRNPWWW